MMLNDNNNKNLHNDNNNNVSNYENRNVSNEHTLISIHWKRKSQILKTIHGTKYTATTNQSFTSTKECSNQRFTTKPKVSKLLNNSGESWESTEKSNDKYTENRTTNQLNIHNTKYTATMNQLNISVSKISDELWESNEKSKVLKFTTI